MPLKTTSAATKPTTEAKFNQDLLIISTVELRNDLTNEAPEIW